MNKIGIIILALSLVLVSLYFLIMDHCPIYKPAWLRRMRNPDYATRAEVTVIAEAYGQAGALPPETGFDEFAKPDNNKALRCQYIDGRPALIGTGRDMQFGTADDIVSYFEPGADAPRRVETTADANAPTAVSSAHPDDGILFCVVSNVVPTIDGLPAYALLAGTDEARPLKPERLVYFQSGMASLEKVVERIAGTEGLGVVFEVELDQKPIGVTLDGVRALPAIDGLLENWGLVAVRSNGTLIVTRAQAE